MRYTIISINEDRRAYKDKIHNFVDLSYEEIGWFDANKRDPLKELDRYGLKLYREPYWIPKTGELGVWLSTMSAWRRCAQINVPLIVFEDDAIVEENFMRDLEDLMLDLPKDWGFLSLWVPPNQYQDLTYNVKFDDLGYPTINGHVQTVEESVFYIGSRRIAKAYQGYGNVATLYSPIGAKQMLDAVDEVGLINPIDCFIYLMAHSGRVDGFAPFPARGPVNYDWSQKTTVRNTKEV